MGAGLGATLLAGCSTDSAPSDGEGDDPASATADGVTASSGTFRLLISDRPADIGDFDRLDVSFDRARIFRAGGDDAENEEEADGDVTESETGEAETDATETEADGEDAATETQVETAAGEADDDGTESASEGPDDGEQRGFSVVELGGATVDLTQVVGNKAVSISEMSLEEGRYTKIELYAQRVEGVVDGESVDVTIPSGKLQIVKPFEVVAGETLSFVFDINVVRKGQSSEYNLLPVIAESGVAGEDVEVDEVEKGTDGSNGTGGADSDDEETEPGPDESGGDGEEGADAGADEGGGPSDGETGDS